MQTRVPITGQPPRGHHRRLSSVVLPPHPACPGEPLAESSVLHLIQPLEGGNQFTCLITVAFGGCADMLNAFGILNSSIEDATHPFE